jgi:hypothetical protein
VGHSITDDFKHLKLNKDEFQCEMRDISTFSLFQRIKSPDGHSSRVSSVVPSPIKGAEDLAPNTSFTQQCFT